MGSICERISVISRIVFEIFDHICGPFIYAYHNSANVSVQMGSHITHRCCQPHYSQRCCYLAHARMAPTLWARLFRSAVPVSFVDSLAHVENTAIYDLGIRMVDHRKMASTRAK